MSDLVQDVVVAMWNAPIADEDLARNKARAAIKTVLDDMRASNTNKWNDLEVKAFLDAYEKDRLNDTS